MDRVFFWVGIFCFWWLLIILAYVNCCVHLIDECVRDISTIFNKCIYFVEKHLFMKRKT